jgi:phosphoglycerate dehydrogenase-like enzyme
VTRPNVALITSDFILDPWLNQIAEELRARGFEIISGPKQAPPAKTVFDKRDFGSLFSATDLIVSTTRSLLPRDVLEASPRLRGVVFPTIGTESIDLQAATELGIAVANGPTPENFNSMAESTVLLMLALMYDLHATERVLAENLPRPTTMRARMMAGKTVGLVGFGRIARAVADRLQGWGMRIVAFDPYLQQSQVPANVELVDLQALLWRSDIVSVHTTLTADTKHLINEAALETMKRSAFLINTSRGGVVDEKALYAALKSHRIAGAALDAFELEPLPPDHPLRELDNVILTPHMVGHTQEIFDAIPGAALQNIDRIMEGQAPLYLRNPDVLPIWQQRLAQLAS